MHIVKDENGNLCAHEHGQEHCHHHGDEHHCHEAGEHCHGGHCHSHDEDAAPADKTAALLKYMLDHNTHHAAELDQMADKLVAEGQEKAAEQIRKAVDEFQKGNLYLSLALSLVNEV